jgi:hypothetical protein
MANTAGELPCDRSWTAEPHAPLETLDQWIEELHKAVDASPLCSWPRAMKGKDQAIQSIGVATLNYGYRFKFRFSDDECGDLFYHGAAVGSVFDILRENFRPRRTVTLEGDLLRKFGCVPPLVWFSSKDFFACAAWYPQHMNFSGFACGEPLALDAPQPVRIVFHARVNKAERLTHKHAKKNDQHAFAPQSVLSIVGLDVIATCFSATREMGAFTRELSFPTVDMSDYHNIDFLQAKLSEILGQAIRPSFADEPFDPRSLHTKSLEEMTRLAHLVKTREELLQDQKDIVAFHTSLLRGEGDWNAAAMSELVHRQSERVNSLLREAKEASEADAEGMSTAETARDLSTAMDIVSSRLKSEDLASIPSSGRQLASFMGEKLLKKYKSKLRFAKVSAYTEKCETYEWACSDPFVASEITESAASSNEQRK